MIFLFLFLAVSAFLFGFFLGTINKPSKNISKLQYDDSDISELQKEYENFLKYDGTEQQ